MLMYIYIYLSLCIYICIHMYVCMYVCMYVYIYICICMYICMHIFRSLTYLPLSRVAKPLSGAKPCFFGSSGFCGRRSRVSVSVGAGLDLKKSPTKSAQDCSEISNAFLHVKSCHVRSTFGRWGRRNVHQKFDFISYKIDDAGALLEDEVGRKCTRQWREPNFT